MAFHTPLFHWGLSSVTILSFPSASGRWKLFKTWKIIALKISGPTHRIDFLLSIFLHTTNSYHKYLKNINIQTNRIEKDLESSTRNEELHKLLKMEKCLVYFTTSLRANELLLARLRNTKYIKPDSYSEELLEDVIIENKQAIEMANIYSDIQSGMMDAFASIISNNLNIVMKQLTTVTVILMIPTLVSSFFGMNVPNSFEITIFRLSESWRSPSCCP